jgi:hypothetical protein
MNRKGMMQSFVIWVRGFSSAIDRGWLQITKTLVKMTGKPDHEMHPEP